MACWLRPGSRLAAAGGSGCLGHTGGRDLCKGAYQGQQERQYMLRVCCAVHPSFLPGTCECACETTSEPADGKTTWPASGSASPSQPHHCQHAVAPLILLGSTINIMSPGVTRPPSLQHLHRNACTSHHPASNMALRALLRCRAPTPAALGAACSWTRVPLRPPQAQAASPSSSFAASDSLPRVRTRYLVPWGYTHMHCVFARWMMPPKQGRCQSVQGRHSSIGPRSRSKLQTSCQTQCLGQQARVRW